VASGSQSSTSRTPQAEQRQCEAGGDAGQRRTQSALHGEEARSLLLSYPAAAEEERTCRGAG
jgi:hypothetical protein